MRPLKYIFNFLTRKILDFDICLRWSSNDASLHCPNWRLNGESISMDLLEILLSVVFTTEKEEVSPKVTNTQQVLSNIIPLRNTVQ